MGGDENAVRVRDRAWTPAGGGEPRAAARAGDAVLRAADLVMDIAAYRVQRGGREVRLRPLEFRLLRQFLESPERVLTRDELVARLHGAGARVAARSIDGAVYRLRKSLTSAGEPDCLRTVWGVGYILEPSQDR